MPEILIKQWLGHSLNLMDLYAAQLRYDAAYRREWCDSAGLYLNWANWAINRGCQFAHI